MVYRGVILNWQTSFDGCELLLSNDEAEETASSANLKITPQIQ